MTEEAKVEQTFEIGGKTWRLWYRRGQIVHLRRTLNDRDVAVHEDTLAVDLMGEAQRRYPNEDLLQAALALPDENDDPTLFGKVSEK